MNPGEEKASRIIKRWSVQSRADVAEKANKLLDLATSEDFSSIIGVGADI